MKSNKIKKLSKTESVRRENIKNRVKTESVVLNHPKGLERFNKIINRSLNQKN
jgi:hypothetical protein